MNHYITTQREIRRMFWAKYPEIKRHSGWTQNQYPTSIRIAFCDYVEYLYRNGAISDKLAERATL